MHGARDTAGIRIELIEDGITPDRLVEAAHKSFSASLGTAHPAFHKSVST
jgi:hypothetical protein